MPRLFSEEALDALDKLEEEEARPLQHEQAVEMAAAAGMAPRPSLDHVNSTALSDDVIEGEMHHFRVVHHLSEEELRHRRTGGGGSATAAVLLDGGHGATTAMDRSGHSGGQDSEV